MAFVRQEEAGANGVLHALTAPDAAGGPVDALLVGQAPGGRIIVAVAADRAVHLDVPARLQRVEDL